MSVEDYVIARSLESKTGHADPQVEYLVFEVLNHQTVPVHPTEAFCCVLQMEPKCRRP